MATNDLMLMCIGATSLLRMRNWREQFDKMCIAVNSLMRMRNCRKQFDANVHWRKQFNANAPLLQTIWCLSTLPPNILMRKRNATEQFDVTHLRSGVGLSRSLRYSTRSFGTAPFYIIRQASKWERMPFPKKVTMWQGTFFTLNCTSARNVFKPLKKKRKTQAEWDFKTETKFIRATTKSYFYAVLQKRFLISDAGLPVRIHLLARGGKWNGNRWWERIKRAVPDFGT